MVRLKHLLLIFFFSAVAGAQTLTCTDNCPTPSLFSMRTSSPVLASSGQNQVWDFRNLAAISSSTFPSSYVLPNAVPASSIYPSCNLVLQSANPDSYLLNNGAGIHELFPNSGATTSSRMLVPFPFSFGMSYTETVNSSEVAGSDTFVTTWQSTLSAVGSGTLLLPFSTYSNVLCVKLNRLQTRTKNASAFGNNIQNTSYYFYSPGLRHHILYTRQLFETGGSDFGPYTEFISEQITGIEELQKNASSRFIVSPNPTNSGITVHETLKGNHIRIVNTLQQTVYESSVEGPETVIDLLAVPAGMYLIYVETASGTASQKLMKY